MLYLWNVLQPSVRRRSLTFLGLAFAAVIVCLSGCRDKVSDNGGEGEPGVWRLELRAPAVMYRSSEGHVQNDTIAVRVYNPAGVVQGGITILSYALKSPDSVAARVLTVTDTIAKPYGTASPVFYWGAGDPDPNLQEVITSKAVLQGDTLATAEVRFYVRNHGFLVVSSADTMYHTLGSGVDHDTISVRAFDGDGQLAGNVVLNCWCEISIDSVTARATTFVDTLLKPWGTINPITYWGMGNPEAYETVTCRGVISGDTVQASKSFLVWIR